MAEEMSEKKNEASRVETRGLESSSRKGVEAASQREEKRKNEEGIFGERAGKKICVTRKEIEALINEACEGAEEAQGSHLAWRPDDSQP